MNIVYQMMVSMKGTTDFTAYSKSAEVLSQFKQRLEALENPDHPNRVYNGCVVFVSTLGEQKGFNIYPTGEVDLDSSYIAQFMKTKLDAVNDTEVFIDGFGQMMPNGSISALYGPRSTKVDGEIKYNPIYGTLLMLTPEFEAAILADLKISK